MLGKQPVMRERQPVYEDKLRTCSECEGYYSNKYFYKHKCLSKSPAAIKPTLLRKTNMTKIDSDEEFQDILIRFLDGEVGDLIRSNYTIQLIGYKHFCLRRHGEGKDDEVRKVVMSDMRELSRLYLTFQEIIGDTVSVEDMFKRENIQDLQDAIEKMVTKEDKSEKYGLKLLLDAIILRTIKTLKGHYSESIQDDKAKELKYFEQAYKYKSCQLFPKARHASIKQSKEKSRKPANLPDEIELTKLQDYILFHIKRITSDFQIRNYKELRTLVVARLTLFNARRGEEAPRILIKDWENAEIMSGYPRKCETDTRQSRKIPCWPV